MWVIVTAVEDLPAGEQRTTAQQHLVKLAQEQDTKRLRVLAHGCGRCLREKDDHREG